MIVRWVIAVVVLPINMTVVIPAAIVWLTRETAAAAEWAAADSPLFWLAVALAIPGATLSAWATSLFFRFGDGTAAPWDPPQKLVVRGPYRHVRNPMLSGVIMLLFAEASVGQSWPLLVWAIVFFATNAAYFPLSEEPGLVKRFGDAYVEYRANVPRWLPRVTPWTPPETRG